jgi:3-hydroxy-9,10-secoandrosta-1,3,5(10)-triene-9,17-dione monooxygenase
VTSVPGPGSLDELLARAERLVPALRERAAHAEEIRRVPDETIADLHDAGLFRMMQPKRVGGSELAYESIVRIPAVIGRGCGSTAWVLGNLASHHLMLGYWPREAQDEIWGASPDHLIGSALIYPCGRAHRVPGGYRLSGRWPFSSGVDPSVWNMIGGLVQDEAGGAPEPHIFILPAADYTVIDTWHVTGLRGTGSKDVAVDDAFVPEHRALAVAQISGGRAPGSEINPSPLYRLPLVSLFGFIIASTSLGIAKGALEQYVAATRSRAGSYTGQRLAELTTLQLRIAEAGALIDAAEALMLKDCDEATRLAAEDVVPPLEQKARWRRDGAFAATLCTKAVDLLFAASGGAGIYEKNPIQRSFRDIHAANAHFGLNWDVNGTVYGRVALGLTDGVAL